MQKYYEWVVSIEETSQNAPETYSHANQDSILDHVLRCIRRRRVIQTYVLETLIKYGRHVVKRFTLYIMQNVHIFSSYFNHIFNTLTFISLHIIHSRFHRLCCKDHVALLKMYFFRLLAGFVTGTMPACISDAQRDTYIKDRQQERERNSKFGALRKPTNKARA